MSVALIPSALARALWRSSPETNAVHPSSRNAAMWRMSSVRAKVPGVRLSDELTRPAEHGIEFCVRPLETASIQIVVDVPKERSQLRGVELRTSFTYTATSALEVDDHR